MSFGLTLRDWRQRRRYSQLSLGLEADISARHICFLENGKSNPSREVIGKLCDALDVPRADRNTFLSTAGYAPAFEARDWDSNELSAVRAATDYMLKSHDPFPGFALNRHWQIMRMNNAGQLLLGTIGLGIGSSLLDSLTENSLISDSIINLDEVRAHMRARLQTESNRYGGDPILEAARAKLTHETAPAGLNPAVIPIEFSVGDLSLSLFSVLAHFSSTEDIAIADMKIELLFPTDSQTEETLRTFAT